MFLWSTILFLGCKALTSAFLGKVENSGKYIHTHGEQSGTFYFAVGIESLQSTSELPSPYLLYLSTGTVPSVANSTISDTWPCYCQKHQNVEALLARDWGGAGEAQMVFCHIFCPVYFGAIPGDSWGRSPTDRQTHSHIKLNSYIVAKCFTGTTLIWQGLLTTSSEVHACCAVIHGGFLVYLLFLFYSADLTW